MASSSFHFSILPTNKLCIDFFLSFQLHSLEEDKEKQTIRRRKKKAQRKLLVIKEEEFKISRFNVNKPIFSNDAWLF